MTRSQSPSEKTVKPCRSHDTSTGLRLDGTEKVIYDESSELRMKIAITGATGFIGRPLIDLLVREGHSVVALSRHPETVRGMPAGVEMAAFDASRPLPPENLHGADAVVHLAGENIAGSRWTAEQKQRIRESRERGTAMVVDAAKAAGTVRTLVSASAVGYYGDRGAEPLTEASSPGPDFLAEVCRVWEKPVRAAEDAGIRGVVVRLGVVLHPSGGALAKLATPFKLGVGGRIGSGEQYMSWIHREDAVRLFVHALNNEGLRGPVNGTAPNPVTNAEFTKALGQALHRPTLFPVPAFALKTLFGELADSLLTGQRVLPKRAEESGFVFRFPTLAAALADLFNQASVKKG